MSSSIFDSLKSNNFGSSESNISEPLHDFLFFFVLISFMLGCRSDVPQHRDNNKDDEQKEEEEETNAEEWKVEEEVQMSEMENKTKGNNEQELSKRTKRINEERSEKSPRDYKRYEGIIRECRSVGYIRNHWIKFGETPK